jgi:pyruvate/2-oxoglutarate dehydrogenase complex dihydrolipoamide dehydrogenase (E3) component
VSTQPTTVNAADRTLEALVRPPDWQNPRPQRTYDLVVIGGGTAGLVSAVGAAGLGARVAIVERDQLGGDCLITGCVPSKAILRTARAVGELRRAAGLGIRATGVDLNFSEVMTRMRQRRAGLAVNDSAQRLSGLGIDVFFGDASFISAREIAVSSATLRFTRAVIATGSRPSSPPIDGLSATAYLTNETIFELTERPERLLVIGGGPVGCELSQAFARLGSRVTLFDQAQRLLTNDDADASCLVQRALTRDGVHIELGAAITRISHRDGKPIVQFRRGPDAPHEDVAGDRLLVATGRTPNIDGLDLARAGIQAGLRGVMVDDRLRTGNRRVYAAGDVCSRFQFTHVADATARIVVQNALFLGRRKASALTVPWCTYTDPEVAHVGLSADDAEKRRPAVQTISVPLSEVDRAVLDDETEGFVRVHHERGRLLGCTIVAAHAGEMIGQVSYAIARGVTLNDFASTVYPYPTQSEALRKAGDAYRRTRLTPRVRSAFERYFRITRW